MPSFKETPFKVWPWLAGACLVLPLLLGGTSRWPNELNCLRNPLLFLTLVTAISIAISPRFRAIGREYFTAPENLLSSRTERNLAFGLFGYFFLFFLKVLWQNYRAFEVTAIDFSIFDYMLFNTGRGLFMQCVQGLNHFGVHSTPILFLLYPLHRLFLSPLFLHFSQAVILWSAAIPLYQLLRRNLTVPLHRLMILFAFFNFNYLSQVLSYNFHVEVFYVPLFLWLFLFLQQQRWPLFWTMVFLLLTVKEDAALYLLGVSGGMLFMQRYAVPLRIPILLAVVALCTFWLNTQWFIPMNAQGHDYQLAAAAAKYGRTFPEVWNSVLGNWDKFLGDVATGQWLRAAAGFLFLPLLVPFTLISILPFAIIHALAQAYLMKNIMLYYSAPYIPFLFFGYILYLRQPAIPFTRKPFWTPLKSSIVLFTFLYISLVGGSYLSIRKTHPDFSWMDELRSQTDFRKPMCAQGSLIPHLPYPAQVRLLDKNCVKEQVSYYLVHPAVSGFPLVPQEANEIFQALDRNPIYIKKRFGGIVLFQKR